MRLLRRRGILMRVLAAAGFIMRLLSAAGVHDAFIICLGGVLMNFFNLINCLLNN